LARDLSKMKKFKEKEFVSVYKDAKTSIRYATLNPEGMKLISSYYKDKYSAKINLPSLEDERGRPYYEELNHLLEEPESYLGKLRKNSFVSVGDQGEYRELLLFGVGTGHSIPVLYIKNGNKEAFLLANSTGRYGDHFDKLKEFSEKLLPERNVKIFIINEGWQADYTSCFLGGIIFGRDATRKEKNDYFIPNLLEYFETNSREDERGNLENVKEITSLPPKLLKHTQRESFISLYLKEEESTELVHKQENLQQFRGRFSENVLGQNWKLYLQKKGLSLTSIIEIQFYIVQLKQQFQEKFTAEIQKKFISGAKQLLYNTSNPSIKEANKISLLFNYSEEFIKKEEALIEDYLERMILEKNRTP